MARLNVVQLPQSKKQRKHLSGIGGKAARGFRQDEEEGVPRPGVLGDLNGKVQCTVANPCIVCEKPMLHVGFLLKLSQHKYFSIKLVLYSQNNCYRNRTNGIKAKPIPTAWQSNNLQTQDAPYASAQWSLAVAYDVGSWRGGLRQQYYFGRFTAFLDYRRRRKAALRARVETRMVKRWAMQRNFLFRVSRCL